MEIRREQVVFLVAAGILGWMTYSKVSVKDKRGGSGSAAPPELVNHPAPDLGLVTARTRDWDDIDRELLEPPRDTRPLPPLEVVLPPLEPIPALLPPPVPGPEARLFGSFLRVRPEVEEVVGLFAADSAEAIDEAESEDLAALDDLAVDALSPEEQVELIQSWKRVYDWITDGQLKFGQITNEARYRLTREPDRPIQFLEFDPRTGAPRFGNQPPIAYERSRIVEFGFADTVANRMELRAIDFEGQLSLGDYSQALAFAEWCVEKRLEAPRALQVAESVYRRAEPFASDDPAPQLGLARCYEAGFQFEKAFQLYKQLLGGGFDKHPVVHTRLAELEARFRLFAQAEARYREAERWGRASYELQWSYGRFLIERGRAAEAIEHLRAANKFAPSDREFKSARVGMRVDLGRALVASGEVAEGLSWFSKATQLDGESQLALAGTIAATLCTDVSQGRLNGSSTPTLEADGGLGTGGAIFELLVNSGVQKLAQKEYLEAEQSLRLAAEADPLRAYVPWRALSFLATQTGYNEDALTFIDLAYENNPVDPYTLYQRGRVLMDRGDLSGAAEFFVLALDRELQFPEALAALGEIAHRQGAFDDADLYLERALSIDPALVDVRALRGLNFLELADVEAARAEFDQVLDDARDHPTARSGRAWCIYLSGDAPEAITTFAELDDARRGFPEDDAHRVYAKAMIETIQDHQEKSVWTDIFNRASLGNSWVIDESGGPTVTLVDGAVNLSGQFDSSRNSLKTRLYRERGAAEFVSLEVELVVDAGGRARSGIFLSREKFNQRTGTEVQSEVTVSRHPDGNLQTRVLQRAQDDADTPFVDWPAVDWPAGEPMTLRIEREGEANETTIRVVVNGIPVLEDERLPTLGRANTNVRFGVFSEGENGRNTKVEVRKVEVVYRDR